MTSCYVLEFSVAPGGARHAEGHAYSDLGAIVVRLERLLGLDSPDGADGYVVGLVFYPATLVLWVVQRGLIERVIDLRAFLTMTFDDGRSARLDDADALAPLEDAFNRDAQQRVRFSLDSSAFAAAVPLLEPPLLRAGQTIEAERAPGLVTAGSSYLDGGIELEFGSWDLEEGSELPDDD